MDGAVIANRMRQIITEKGMQPKEFYGDSDGYSKKLTKSNFYNYYNGTVKKPSFDFICNFCDIAGITVFEFFNSGVDEFVLSDDEKKMVIDLRSLKNADRNHLKRYLEFLLHVNKQ